MLKSCIKTSRPPPQPHLQMVQGEERVEPFLSSSLPPSPLPASNLLSAAQSLRLAPELTGPKFYSLPNNSSLLSCHGAANSWDWKSTHFCGCDFRQNELFIKRWILAQCKPINSKLSEHNVNPIVHQVDTNYLELLVHLHSWVSNCQIPLPNSTAKFCNCLKNDNFTSLAEIYCWT